MFDEYIRNLDFNTAKSFLRKYNISGYNEENQTVQYRSFSTQIRDDKFFMIPSELQNESFVINGQGFVFDGQKVTVVNSEKNLLPENNSEEIKWI